MESDMKAALDALVEWWKRCQRKDVIEGGDMDELRDVMARLCLKYIGKEGV